MSDARLSQAYLYDPPVERYSFSVCKRLTRFEFGTLLCEILGVGAQGLKRFLWHGGLYLDRTRILDHLPSAVEPKAEIEIYHFVREPQVPELGASWILYEDDDLLIVNKPAWMPVQGTRVSLRFCLEEILRVKTGNPTLMAAHRLDRQTSGAMIFAKNQKAAGWIMTRFAERQIHKKYLAVVSPPPEKDQWEVDGFLGRDFKKLPLIYFRLLSEEKPKSRFSHSRFKLLKIEGPLALVEGEPVTGRTHQLRVHLASTGNPIVGDRLYAGGSYAAMPKVSHIQLHAARITLPIKGKREVMTVEAPVPEGFLMK